MLQVICESSEYLKSNFSETITLEKGDIIFNYTKLMITDTSFILKISISVTLMYFSNNYAIFVIKI